MSINRRPTNEPDLSHVIPQWTDSQEDAVEFSSLLHGGAIPAMDALKTAVHQLRNKGGGGPPNEATAAVLDGQTEGA